MRRFFLMSMVMFFSIYSDIAWAQNGEQVAVEQALDLWQIYRYVDGLAGNTVFEIFQDKDGILWFGTNGGLSRFDGVDWTTYTTEDGLAQDPVWAIEQDGDGMIWARTSAHLYGNSPRVSRFDGKQWKAYTTADGLAGDIVNDIFRDEDGVIWFATDGGVTRFDGENWTSYTTADGLIDNQVRCIAQDTEGGFWFGTDSGASHFDGKDWDNYSQEDGLVIAPVRVIFQDRDDALWFGGGIWRGEKENRVSRFDGKIWTTYTLPMDRVVEILQDRKGGFWFIGGYFDHNGVSYFDGRQWKQYTTQNGLGHNGVMDILEDNEGSLWFGTGWFYTGDVVEPLGGVSRFDGKRWTNYTDKDGLAGHMTTGVLQDRQGIFWFSDLVGGASRLDRQTWFRYITPDGNSLVRRVFSIIRSQDGALWFATGGWGVYRYDGKNWTRYSEEEGGLGQNDTRCIFQDRDGVFWFATFMKGLSCFDGKSWMTYGTEDGLASMRLRCIFQDRDGGLWVGTWDKGVSRFDGKNWKSYSPEDSGLAGEQVPAIFQDQDGVFWFMTNGGISRFDGVNWQTFPQQKTQEEFEFWGAIYQDSDGILWFGGKNGLSRFDGRTWKTYTRRDGLPDNYVTAIAQDQAGHLWIGTFSGGVSRFDGRTFQRLDSRDGLPNDKIGSIFITKSDQIWIGTEDDLVRFVPGKIPPSVSITRILADEKAYERPTGTVMLGRSIRRVSFGFRGVSFKTLPGRMLYYYRLIGSDPDWRGPTNQESIEYFNLKPGEYTFKVQAADRDLNYSEPAPMSVVIPPPPFYQTGIFTLVLSIVGGASLFVAIILAVHRWRTSRAEKLRLQQELDDAHRMQLGLLPESAPSIEGFDIAGFSRPAREVGGDFFDYLSLDDGKVGVALADVSDKGLKAAMNAVLANGMLHEVARNGASCGRILSRLNADLYPRIEKQMFTALGLAILEPDAKTLHWANAAQPHPMVKRDGQVFEFKSDTELPLGMMPNVTYPDWDLDLQAGDVVIFYTDGIIEAENEAREMYGIGRLEQVIMNLGSTVNAEETIEAILQDVTDFAGSAEQYDDMTVVVVKKLQLVGQ